MGKRFIIRRAQHRVAGFVFGQELRLVVPIDPRIHLCLELLHAVALRLDFGVAATSRERGLHVLPSSGAARAQACGLT